MIHDAIESRQISLSDSLAVADKRRRLNIEIDFTSFCAPLVRRLKTFFPSNSNITGRLLRLERINPAFPPRFLRSIAYLRSTFIMYSLDKSYREMANLCESGRLIFQPTFSETSTRFEYDLIRSTVVGLPKKGPRNSFSPLSTG